MLVTKELLNRPNVITALEQMCGEAMAQSMGCDLLRKASRSSGPRNGSLYRTRGSDLPPLFGPQSKLDSPAPGVRLWQSRLMELVACNPMSCAV